MIRFFCLRAISVLSAVPCGILPTADERRYESILSVFAGAEFIMKIKTRRFRPAGCSFQETPECVLHDAVVNVPGRFDRVFDSGFIEGTLEGDHGVAGFVVGFRFRDKG